MIGRISKDFNSISNSARFIDRYLKNCYLCINFKINLLTVLVFAIASASAIAASRLSAVFLLLLKCIEKIIV